MYIGKKYRIDPRGFRHRIRENFGEYYDHSHLLGIDPFDSTKFPHVYEPPTNVKEKEDAYTLEIMIPGFTKEEVSISVVEDCLLIEGNKENDVMEDGQDYIHHEHIVKGFRREFYLNPSTNKENIGAKFENGVLRVTLRKVELKDEAKKAVEVE